MNALYRFLLMVPNGAQLKELATFYESGSIKPVIDKTYDFDSSIQALEYLSKGRAKGKVIVNFIDQYTIFIIEQLIMKGLDNNEKWL